MNEHFYSKTDLQKFVHDVQGAKFLKSWNISNASLEDSVRLIRALNNISNTNLTEKEIEKFRSNDIGEIENLINSRKIKNPAIHKTQDTTGWTSKEKMAIGGLFALNAFAVCTSIIPMLRESVYGILPFLITYAGCAILLNKQNKAEFKRMDLKKASEVCTTPEELLKLSLLKKDLEEMASKEKTPAEIALENNSYTGASRYRGKNYVVLRRALFQQVPYQEMKPVTAHEFSHLKHRHTQKRNHFTQASVASMLQGLPTSIAYLFSSTSTFSAFDLTIAAGIFLGSAVPFFLNGTVRRQFEYQADRTAAVLEGTPNNLIKYYNGCLEDEAISPDQKKFKNVILNSLWKGATVITKQGIMPVLDFIYESNPKVSKSIKALKNLSQAQKPFENLMKKIKNQTGENEKVKKLFRKSRTPSLTR